MHKIWILALFSLLLTTACTLENNNQFLEYDNSITTLDAEINIAVEDIGYAYQDIGDESLSTSISIDRARKQVEVIQENVGIIRTNSQQILDLLPLMEEKDSQGKYEEYIAKMEESYNYYLEYSTKIEENMNWWDNYLNSEEYYVQFYKDYEQINENDALIDSYLLSGDNDKVRELVQENVELITVAKEEIHSANNLFPIYDSYIEIMSNWGLIYGIYEDSSNDIEDGYFMVSDSETERLDKYYTENYNLIPTESEWNEIIEEAFIEGIEIADEADDLELKAERSYNEAVEIWNNINNF